MVKTKLAKVLSATLVASMILGMTAVVSADDTKSLSEQAAVLEETAKDAAEGAKNSTTLADLELNVNKAVKSLEDAEALLKQAQKAYDDALAIKDYKEAEAKLAECKELKETQLYLAYQAVLDAAKKTDKDGNEISAVDRVYTGKEQEDGNLSFGREDINKSNSNAYWAAAENFMFLYIKYYYGDDVKIAAKDNIADGLAEFASNSVKNTYGNYWAVTLADGTVKNFNVHVIDKLGNIAIVDKTLVPGTPAVDAVPGKEAEYKYAYVNAEGVVDKTKTIEEEDALVFSGDNNEYAYIIRDEEAVNTDKKYKEKEYDVNTKNTTYSIGTIEVPDKFGTKFVPSTNTEYYGWLEFNKTDEVKKDVKEYLEKDSNNAVEIKYGCYLDFLGWFTDKVEVFELMEISDWNQFWKNLGVASGLYYYSVNFGTQEEDKTKIESTHDETGIIATTTANVKIKKHKYENRVVEINEYTADKYVYTMIQEAVEAKPAVAAVPQHWTEKIFVTTLSEDLTTIFDKAKADLEVLEKAVDDAKAKLPEGYDANSDAPDVTAAKDEMEKVQASVDTIKGYVESAKGVTLPADDNNNDTPAAGDDNNNDTPAADDNNNDTPAADDNNNDTPAADDNNNDTPAADDNNNDTPAADDNKNDTPAVDDNNNTTPAANNNNQTPAAPANVNTITDNMTIAATGDDTNAEPAMDANLFTQTAPVANDAQGNQAATNGQQTENVADETVPQASAKQTENVSDEAVPQASAADESSISWLWLLILIAAAAAGITGYTIYKKNNDASEM